jgi:hypothetical protein
VGVEVRQSSFENGTARFTLEALGPAGLGEKSDGARPRDACGIVSGFQLAISGFSAGDGAEAIEADVARVLAAPEAYLAARGVEFAAPAGSAPQLVASRERNASFAERSLAQQVTAWQSATRVRSSSWV